MSYSEGQPDSSSELLIEGLRSYRQALVAMEEFCLVVEGIFREAVKKSPIRECMEIRFQADSIKSYRRPDKVKGASSHKRVALGVSIPGEGFEKHTYSLEWNRDQDSEEFTRSIVVSISFSELEAAGRVLLALQRELPNEELGLVRQKVYLSKELPMSDLEQRIERLPSLIDAQIGKWCEAWKRVDGLPNFLKQ